MRSSRIKAFRRWFRRFLLFSIFLVGEIFFPSWGNCFLSLYSLCSLFSLSCVCSPYGWEWRILGGDKGAAPPRAQAPSPCPVGLTPSPQTLQPLAEGVHRIQVAHHDEQLQEPLCILHEWFLMFLHLPEHIKEIGYTNEWDCTEGEPHDNLNYNHLAIIFNSSTCLKNSSNVSAV